jgi:hypothetical protein
LGFGNTQAKGAFSIDSTVLNPKPEEHFQSATLFPNSNPDSYRDQTPNPKRQPNFFFKSPIKKAGIIAEPALFCCSLSKLSMYSKLYGMI